MRDKVMHEETLPNEVTEIIELASIDLMALVELIECFEAHAGLLVPSDPGLDIVVQ